MRSILRRMSRQLGRGEDMCPSILNRRTPLRYVHYLSTSGKISRREVFVRTGGASSSAARRLHSNVLYPSPPQSLRRILYCRARQRGIRLPDHGPCTRTDHVDHRLHPTSATQHKNKREWAEFSRVDTRAEHQDSPLQILPRLFPVEACSYWPSWWMKTEGNLDAVASKI